MTDGQVMTAKQLGDFTVAELAELVRPMVDGLVIVMDDGTRVRVKVEHSADRQGGPQET